MSPMERMPLEVGQRWRYSDYWTVTLIRAVRHGMFEGEPDNGGDTGYFSAEMLANAEFLGYAPGHGPQPPTPSLGSREWARWLPQTKPLPRGAGGKFKAGQVWFVPSYGNVVRATDGDWAINLASNGDWSTDTYGKLCVTDVSQADATLIQDVGQAEPTPPDVLFPRVPSPPGPTAAPKKPASPTCARMECHAPGPFSRDGECWFHYLETEQVIATKTAGNADLKRRLREATGRPARVLFPSIPEYPGKTPVQSHALVCGGVFSLRSSR